MDAFITVMDDDVGRTGLLTRRSLGGGFGAVLGERLVIALALHGPFAEPVGGDVHGRVRGHGRRVAGSTGPCVGETPHPRGGLSRG